MRVFPFMGDNVISYHFQMYVQLLDTGIHMYMRS